MMESIIKVEKLGKRYAIGRREPYRTMRDSLTGAVTGPLRSLRARLSRNGGGAPAASNNHLWALEDVSFEVAPGEVLGVIGRNGAGKSTLLKVLSRITEPTTGRVELYGRVASLLEIGTGFHQELTGRENVYLSGAIMGMRRAEIARKFDEIIAFAEIEDFVDTPVKRYSSGMYVRLAFAVAAHLEPEILLVDEVLAVGDLAFQKKCLGKMGEVARFGRTVLFVSHNMAAIEALCTRCLRLSGGRLAAAGDPLAVMSGYVAEGLRPGAGTAALDVHPGRRPGDTPTMTRVELRGADGAAAGAIRIGDPLEIRVAYRAQRPLRPVLGSVIRTGHGAAVFCVSDRFCGQLAECAPRAEAMVVCRVERLMLIPGTYAINLWLGDATGDFDVIFDAIAFEVLPADLTGTGRLPPPNLGAVFCEANWSIHDA
ncbi:MAG: ABC transporter ATP-binding protein [Candidatus Binataceae bacterium]|nr:ABC transporter ATP-binding protein [Candidatus Binataceae bacterium]